MNKNLKSKKKLYLWSKFFKDLVFVVLVYIFGVYCFIFFKFMELNFVMEAISLFLLEFYVDWLD